MKVFIIDAAKCNGCYNCQVGCKDEHVDNEWLPYAMPEPKTGQFWMKVKQIEHGQLPVVKVEYRPWLCMHCDTCACEAVCPSGAYVRREDGLIYVDPEKCTGCRDCVEACPYGTVYFNDDLNIAQKCTGCAHLVDEGKLPHCVDLCATGGIRFGDAEEFADEIARAETMLPDLATGPHVYYVNLPHLFLAGEVWDGEADEDIEGATVELLRDGEVLATLQTDDFGDFKFEKLDEGIYDVRILAEGFEPTVVEAVNLDKSRYIGDFKLMH